MDRIQKKKYKLVVVGLGWALLGLIGIGWGALVYINLDKTHVFYEYANGLGDVQTVVTLASDTSDIRQIQIRNARGEFLVECWYRRPRILSPDYRVLLLYTGAKTKETILELIPDRQDVVLCAVQYPYRRPATPGEYARWLYEVRRAAYRVVAGGMVTTTFLTEREHLDASRITIIGASLGSFFGGIHGALDPRIQKVVLVHGGGNFKVMARAYERLRERGWPVEPSAWLADRLFGTFDPVRYVDRISPRLLVVLAARQDRYFPPASAQALYDKAGDPKQLIWMGSAHIRSEKSELLNTILKSINTYLFSDTAA